MVATILLGLQVTEEGLVSSVGWVLASPLGFVVLVAFWLWTPWLLLHGRIRLRLLLPGAVLAAVAYMAAVTVSEFVLGYWITDNGRFFGSFGVVLALVAWAQVVAGIWLAGAVFSPVYAQWRAGWARHGASPFSCPALAGNLAGSAAGDPGGGSPGTLDQVGVDDDVVQVLAGRGVERPAAGDQAQAGEADVAVDLRGREARLD